MVLTAMAAAALGATRATGSGTVAAAAVQEVWRMVQEEREVAAWASDTSSEVVWTHADTLAGGHGGEEVDMLAKVEQLRAANAALKQTLGVEACAAPKTCLANAATPDGTPANFQNGIFETVATGRRAVGPETYYVGEEQAADGGKWWPEGHFSPRGITSTPTTAAKTTPRARPACRPACPGPGGKVDGGLVDEVVVVDLEVKVEDLVVDDVWLWWLAGGPGGPEDVVEEEGDDEEDRAEGEGDDEEDGPGGPKDVVEEEGDDEVDRAEGEGEGNLVVMKVEDLVVDDVWLWLAGGPGGPEDVVEEVEEVGGDEEDRAEGEGQGGDDDDGGREPCRKLSIQVQGGSRLKESSGCLALKYSESESALARPSQGKVDGDGALVAQLMEAIETKSWRNWWRRNRGGTSIEVAGAHPCTTLTAEVCKVATDTLGGGQVEAEALVTTIMDLLQQCGERGLVEEVSILERVLAEVEAGDIADDITDENVELVKRIVALEKLQAEQGTGGDGGLGTAELVDAAAAPAVSGDTGGSGARGDQDSKGVDGEHGRAGEDGRGGRGGVDGGDGAAGLRGSRGGRNAHREEKVACEGHGRKDHGGGGGGRRGGRGGAWLSARPAAN